MATTKIEWSDGVWNPLAGCTMVSRACENCYAMRMAFRLEQMGQEKYKGTTRKTEGGKIVWTGKINFDEKALLAPLKWKDPQRVFVNSMSDLFHEDVPFEFIDKVFSVMIMSPWNTYQILTKREDRMEEYMTNPDTRTILFSKVIQMANLYYGKAEPSKVCFEWPIPNVQLGVTIENQKEADKRIPPLLNCPAAVRFVSCEPLVGPIDLRNITVERRYGTGLLDSLTCDLKDHYQEIIRCGKIGEGPINWVIAGGESGPKAEPSHPDWFRSLRDQCEAAGVPFFFKQWGEWCADYLDGVKLSADKWLYVPLSGDKPFAVFKPGTLSVIPTVPVAIMGKIGKKAAGNLLDGKVYNQFPEGRNEGQNG